ncbi:MAG: hypothetical protein A2X47_11510 [Lentisphaerae bacterium GWF2_38_69]|nr:MAG: hypothetical protein A2X47_11510 [Lentisphaerae bacterium GWF2_38_69]
MPREKIAADWYPTYGIFEMREKCFPPGYVIKARGILNPLTDFRREDIIYTQTTADSFDTREQFQQAINISPRGGMVASLGKQNDMHPKGSQILRQLLVPNYGRELSPDEIAIQEAKYINMWLRNGCATTTQWF